MKKAMFLLLTASLLFVSCNKLLGPSAKAKLTGDPWQGVEGKVYHTDGTLWQTFDLSHNTLTFKTDGTWEFKEDGRLLHHGDWELRNGDKELYMSMQEDGSENTYIIDKLTQTELKYHSDTDANGNPIRNEWSWKR